MVGRGTHRIIGDRRGGVEDAVAPHDGFPQALVVQQITLVQRQSLAGSFQLSQMRILRIVYTQSHGLSPRKKKYYLTYQPHRTRVVFSSSTWVPEGSTHRIASVEEQLDHPRGDEAARAGDADGLAGTGEGVDGHGGCSGEGRAGHRGRRETLPFEGWLERGEMRRGFLVWHAQERLDLWGMAWFEVALHFIYL